MKLLPLLAGFAFVGVALSLAFIPEVPKAMATVTTTITGWNVPSGTTFGHGLVSLILPLVTMSAFAGLALVFEMRGGIVVTMALVGYEIGSIAGMLSLTSSGATDIPFANVLIGAILIGVWVWKGGD